jgi:hypothetical protein
MASAALVGGVLLALIEGMGIMFSRMMAPPVPTAEDYAQAARDVTAPPTAGGLFGSGGSGFPTFGSSPSSASPQSSLDPGPAMSDTFTRVGWLYNIFDGSDEKG